ncbi:MAG TPA: P1 family peptidase, partial [Actinomycetota bacterium]|nr:P1 family peptidase [Actinomycetota bacterium]
SLAIGRAYDATVRWRTDRHRTTTHEGGDMPVVAECDDSFLSDVTTFPLADEDVFAALDGARGGPVDEGCVGAGTGTQCMDFKGGIGTASRQVAGGWMVGALVQTNFGERELLRIDGVPIGREITDLMPQEHSEGSAIVVVATDAPMVPHQIRRLAVRGGLGLGRIGSTGHNGSGELMIAFSTASRIPLSSDDGTVAVRAVLDGPTPGSPDVFNPLFAATVEAVEEAVVNALFTAETTAGRDGHVLHALPLERTFEILARYGRGPAVTAT